MSQLTPYDDVNNILDELTKSLIQILGENLFGIYLTGSLTYGDFDRGSSDIDFLAVIDRDLSKEQFAEIIKMHKRIGAKYPEWEKRIEGQYTPLAWFNNIKRPQGERWYVNGGTINLHRYGNEWVLNYFVLYECGIALFGPDPKDFLKPVDIKDVREASKVNLLEEWQPKLDESEPFKHKDYDSSHLQAYAILTMCRILHRDQNEKVASKRIASAWVKKSNPEWSKLVEDAENWKHGLVLNSEEEIKKFIRFVIGKVN